MAEGSIDRISVDISSDASAAVRSLNNLVTALGNLESKVGSSAAKLLQLSNALSSLKRSVTGFDLTGLKQLNEVKFSKTVPNNLSLLATTLQGMPADSVSKLTGVAMGLRSMSAVSIPKGTVTQIAKLPAVFREFQSLNVAEFSSQLRQLNSQLGPFAANVAKLGSAWSKLPPSLRSVAAAARTVASSNKYLQTTNTALIASNSKLVTSFNNIAASARGAIAKVAALTAAYQVFKRGFQATIGNVNSYIENMNLFEASMGRYTKSATEYGMKIQEVLGIDFGEWARNQGVFMTLATGMGVAADKAAVMSQQLTQLGYDISSFYNMSVEDSMLKLQSGIAGELEPLRRIGWDLSNARMQAEMTSLSIGDLEVDLSDAAMESAALSLGLNKNVASMTQAEKVAIRYHLIMTQVTQVHGDMARTIDSPANQLRVLQAQVQLTARAVGNLLIPSLNAILPVCMAVVKAVRFAAEALASFFGINAKFEVDYSSLDTSGINMGADSFEDAADAAEKATEKAKEYKNTVMGFDELNKLNAKPEDSSSDSDKGKGSGASALDLPLETYDFLEGLKSDIAQRTDEMAQKILGLLPYIGAVATGLAAWKIASALGADLAKCAGLAMAVAGAVMMVYNWLDMWNNGVSWQNLLGYLGGMALLVAGLGTAFGPVAAIVGAIVGLLGLGVVALKDMIANGATWENEFGAALSSLGLGGLAAFLSNLGRISEFLMGWEGLVGEAGLALGILADSPLGKVLEVLGKVAGVIGGIISVVDLIVNGKSIFDAIASGADISAENVFGLCTSILGIGLALLPLTGGVSLVVAAVVAAVAAIAALVYNNWDAICEFFAGIPEWFDTNVIQPVCNFFGGIGDFLGGLWNTIVTGISDWWSGVARWFDDNVIQPMINFWSPIADWFGKLFSSIGATAQAIFHNIGVFADGCWQIIVRVWEVVSGWFDKNVIQPVAGFFSGLWGGVSGAASAAWSAISTAWATVSEWFSENVVQPVAGFFSGLWSGFTEAAEGAWSAVQTVFSGVASWFSGVFSTAWQAVLKVFAKGGEIFNGVVDAILGALKWAVNGLIDGINWAIAQPFAGLNSIIGTMRGLEILGIHPFADFVDVPVPQIPKLAEGRYGIDSGQLFVAREKGAEMVGSMNGHTTVANNQQIVEGIEAGVMSAMVKVMAMQSNSGGEARIEIPLIIGHEEVARAVWRGEASLIRRGKLKPQFA